jgi:hypothetical protein
LTASQSDGSPTIFETQTPQKHGRELVTLEDKTFLDNYRTPACAENNAHLFDYHIPVAEEPDF